MGNRTRKIKAGEVIASGGFGCVFRPALKCKGKSRDTNKVSKLMTTKHAYDEYNDIKVIKDVLIKVPNNQNYFLLDGIYICDPDPLTNEDIKYFKDKCTALPKDDITESNINKKLDEMAVLNMPDGGIDIADFMLDISSDKEFVELNNALINLLINGIVPMNKLRVYHCDIKESNVLIKNGIPRLIDWGLASYNPNPGEVPSGSRNRPFQYNLPFSNIIFNSEFKKEYERMLSSIPNPTNTELHTFVINFVFLWNKNRGPGHLKVINNMFKQMFTYNLIENIDDSITRDQVIEYEYTYHTIVSYIMKILRRFTYDGKFHLDEYVEKVYLKNVDIWGFLMIYSPILENLFNNFEDLTNSQVKLYSEIKKIYVKYLYNTAIHPINVDNLVKDLKNLNPLFIGK
jgi:serine/threonine protein kinase